ncbi:uncharacterized protein LOC144600114 [Rhinoraja longicauda]
MEKPIKEGILQMQHYKFGMKVWKKSWFILYPASSYSIARLEQFDAKEGSTSLEKPNSKKAERIISLSNCINISGIQVENTPKDMSAFYINTTDKNWILAAPKNDVMQWIICLSELAFVDTNAQNKCEDFPASSSMSSNDSFLMKENELYSSISQAKPDNQFTVTVRNTATTTRCNLQGKYTLIVGNDSLILRDPVTMEVAYTWPYQLLRRYGKDQAVFTFEAGRRCDSGEGVFQFNTKEVEKIYHIVKRVVKELESNIECRPLKPISETSIGPGRRASNIPSSSQELFYKISQDESGHALTNEQDSEKSSKTTKSKLNQDGEEYKSACGAEPNVETIGNTPSTKEREEAPIIYATVKLFKDRSKKEDTKNLTLDPAKYRECGEGDDPETSSVYENISEREFPLSFREGSSFLKDIERPIYQSSGETIKESDTFSDMDYVNLAHEWSQQDTEDDYKYALVDQKNELYAASIRKKNKAEEFSKSPETSRVTKTKLPPGFHEKLSHLIAKTSGNTGEYKVERSSKIQQCKGKGRHDS